MCSVIENLSIKMVPKTTTNTWANWATKCTNSNSRDYISYVLSCPYSTVLPNSFILLLEYQVKDSFVLVQKLEEGIYVCINCQDSIAINNLKNKADLHNLRKQKCSHCEAAHILDEKRELENVEEVKLNDQKDQIFKIITEPNEVNIVFPRKKSDDGNVKPGIVVKNNRLSKRRCKTCKGREGCIHLGIFLQAEQEEEILGKIESLRLKEKEDIEKKTEVQSNSKNGKKFELNKTKKLCREKTNAK